MPSFPYTTNPEGKGPSYVCSLFENQAECGLGMAIGVRQRRQEVRLQAEELLELTAGSGLAAAIQNWLDHFDELRGCDDPSKALEEELQGAELSGRAQELAGEMLRHRDHFTKKVLWMFGGDGWAYDIGFGGLDHVIASGEDVNIFVVDTQVYSNTGGQASKATPLGASAKFQAAGKRTQRKDLGRQMMTYGDVYVAQVAMGADPNQLIKAVTEAVAYPGPSIVIAYTPCISHGIRSGMNSVQEEMRRAVEAGFWTLYRYDPLKKDHPLTIDSKEPAGDYKAFLRGETRFAALEARFPEVAQRLFDQAERDVKEKYTEFLRLEECMRR